MSTLRQPYQLRVAYLEGDSGQLMTSAQHLAVVRDLNGL